VITVAAALYVLIPYMAADVPREGIAGVAYGLSIGWTCWAAISAGLRGAP
jgi:hypothetical protein